MDFEALGLSKDIIAGLALQGIDTPTAVQELAIPEIIENKNIVIQSETGSGKTLAYLLPLYARQKTIEPVMQVIVVVPTHELAMQVHHQVQTLSKNSGMPVKSTVIFGDVNIRSQIEKLKEKPQIIIGTAGRLIELIQLRKITAHTIATVVVDEADRMLDINNIERVKTILKAVMRDTQIIMVSASIPDKTLKLAEEIAKSPEIVRTGRKLEIPENIRHQYIVVEARDKVDTLRKLMNILGPKRALAFINSTLDIDIATEKLKYHKMNAASLQGRSSKEDRQRALAGIASGKLRLLVATDIAARGLHIDDVEIVFSVSMPEDPLDYLHRAGRTGRGGAPGLSISIVTKQEVPLITKYQNAFHISMTKIQMHEGKIVESRGRTDKEQSC
ncbi:Superfamily II DNA and RNA helicase [Sporobacter termitidis DSM 10068]|uniref:Superfamily II DNA and RNA helicase n=1 Tax=Sporobacter termitidis DSM 10068 TaxID=1123282 RepID=A0A1M5U096_9FIRM|nr:DEAD/DEAH box helicase [Sporobacter termitidis]SHH56301.1 Superfamily II DNA and RNA helicase [Sporobacter termitidis DSM 10068]